MKAKKSYKKGGKIDEALRANLKKNTSKGKRKVEIKQDPINRAWATGGEAVHGAIKELQNEKGASNIKMGELADRAEKLASKKTYKKGGKIDPPKKKMSGKELERDTAMAKRRLQEIAGEQKYMKKRKEADRAYKQAIKEGATEAQATRIAEKYLSYKKGGILSKAFKKAGYKK